MVFGKKKEEVAEEVPKPAVEEVKKEVWSVQQAATEFAPVIAKGEEIITPNDALVKILNDLELIKKSLGVK